MISILLYKERTVMSHIEIRLKKYKLQLQISKWPKVYVLLMVLSTTCVNSGGETESDSLTLICCNRSRGRHSCTVESHTHTTSHVQKYKANATLLSNKWLFELSVILFTKFLTCGESFSSGPVVRLSQSSRLDVARTDTH